MNNFKKTLIGAAVSASVILLAASQWPSQNSVEFPKISKSVSTEKSATSSEQKVSFTTNSDSAGVTTAPSTDSQVNHRPLKDLLPVINDNRESISMTQEAINSEEEIYSESPKLHLTSGSFALDPYHIPRVGSRTAQVFLQLESLDDTTALEKVGEVGAQILEYMPHRTWIISANQDQINAIYSENNVYAMAEVAAQDKISSKLLNDGFSGNSILENDAIGANVSFSKQYTFEEVSEHLENANVKIIDSGDFDYTNRVKLSGSLEDVAKLATSDLVSVVEDLPPRDSVSNLNAQILSNVDDLQTPNMPGLSGDGVVVGVFEAYDTGSSAKIHSHVQLGNRVNPAYMMYNSNPPLTAFVTHSPDSPHATHVAGIIAANGSGNVTAEGMAPSAELLSFDLDSEMSDMNQRHSNWEVTNHSYGAIIGWNNGVWTGNTGLFGAYTSLSRDFDNYVRTTNKIAVNSAGNDANESGTPITATQPVDPVFQSVGPRASAKNVIAVGAVNQATSNPANFSSGGPTRDGRIKPDLSASGVSLTSTTISNGYRTGNGTSYSAPVVTGVIALLKEHASNTGQPGVYPYRPAVPPRELNAAALKALLINSARDIDPIGPDYRRGWGIVDAERAVEIFDLGPNALRESSVAQNKTVEYQINVNSTNNNFKVTLNWVDPAAAANSSAPLVSDLDLALIAPNGAQWRPWRLNPTAPTNAAFRGINTVDNVEQVEIVNGATGTWRVRVTGRRVSNWQCSPYSGCSNMPQAFALASDIPMN